MKGISIIVTCYNCSKYIEECIESIINLGIKNKYEIIIIDDCSLDNSAFLLKNFQKYSQIKIIENTKNMGSQYSRNIGIENAKFDYLMVIDGDDKLNNNLPLVNGKTYIDRAIEILEKDNDVAFIQGIWEMFGDVNGYTITSYPLNEELIVKKHHVQTSIIHRKSDSVKYSINIKKWQDWSYAISILNKRFKERKKNKIFFIEEPYYLYRIHSITNRISGMDISEEKMIFQTIIENSNIFEKYYGKLEYEEMANIIFKSIPTKMTSMLYVANNNLNIALKMSEEREYYVASPTEPHNFP